MIRTGWLAAFVVALASPPCPAQFGGMGVMQGMGGMGGGMGAMPGMGGMMPQKPAEEWTVKVETIGNQSVTGVVRLPSVVVTCELGIYEIKPERIKAIEFEPHDPGKPLTFAVHGVQREGTVIMATGEKVSGTIAVSNWWRIDTDLGTLTPNAQKLKTFTFIARADASTPGPNSAGKPGSNLKPTDGLQKPGQPNSSKPGEPSSADPEKKS